MTIKDFELIRSKTKGKLTYPRFNQLKMLARNSIGLDDKVYDLLIQTVISSIKYFTETLEVLDQEIVNLFFTNRF